MLKFDYNMLVCLKGLSDNPYKCMISQDLKS